MFAAYSFEFEEDSKTSVIRTWTEKSVKTAILGGGAMATACAVLLAERAEQQVALWARNPDYARSMQQTRVNERLLPGVIIPDIVQVTDDLVSAIQGADFLVVAIPSKFLRDWLNEHASVLQQPIPVISVVKGIEVGTFLRPSQILEDVLGPRDVISLSGPSHAEEIGARLPASVVAACPDRALAKQVQTMFTTDRFRVYTNTDLIGVELAGALKNIIGIAAGISDGLGYGDNAKSSLLTRGIVEMSRFGEGLGADPSTFPGLAGIGDVITTCVSPHGRNRAVGIRLGLGETLDEILATMHSVAEGVTTSKAVYEMSTQQGIEMPITTEVYRVLFEQKSPVEATNSLMLRPPKEE